MSNNPVAEQVALGKAIAQMYIAAQGVSLHVSDKACEAIEEAPRWAKLGFNMEMAKSPYNVRWIENHHV